MRNHSTGRTTAILIVITSLADTDSILALKVFDFITNIAVVGALAIQAASHAV